MTGRRALALCRVAKWDIGLLNLHQTFGGPSVINLEGFSAWIFNYHFPVKSYDTLK